MKLKQVVLTSCIAVGVLALSACGTKPQVNNPAPKPSYPQKTIKIINTLPANIAPDITVRNIASQMSTKYGWKFEFENDPVGKGGNAMNKVWAAPHDGYTVLAHTESVTGPSVYGTSNHPTKDWKFFLSHQVDTAIFVRTSLKINTIEDFIKYAKANPGKVSISAATQGSAFHLKVLAIEKITGAKFNIKHYIGGVGEPQDIKSGKLDAMLTPVQGTMELVNSGVVKPIIMTDPQGYNFGGVIGNIESIVKPYPEFKKYLPLDSFIGFAMPADVPQEAVDAFAKAFDEVVTGPEMTEFVRQSNSILLDLTGKEASTYMSKLESNFTWLTKDAGLAKVDPETLGIPKPH